MILAACGPKKSPVLLPHTLCSCSFREFWVFPWASPCRAWLPPVPHRTSWQPPGAYICTLPVGQICKVSSSCRLEALKTPSGPDLMTERGWRDAGRLPEAGARMFACTYCNKQSAELPSPCRSFVAATMAMSLTKAGLPKFHQLMAAPLLQLLASVQMPSGGFPD